MDGCLGEGNAARVSKTESQQSREPMVQRTLTEVVSDERPHGELGWDIMAWSIQAGGFSVVHALNATGDALSAEADEMVSTDLETLGCASTAQRIELAHKERQACLKRRDTLIDV